MNVRDWIMAGVRTGVQRGVTIGLAAVAAWLASMGIVDVVLDPGPWIIPIDIAATGVVSGLLVKAEKRFTWMSRILSLGLSKDAVTYKDPAFIPTKS